MEKQQFILMNNQYNPFTLNKLVGVLVFPLINEIVMVGLEE
jgi:hypothetical protein